MMGSFSIPIDLRSDTVTMPTAAMLAVIATAPCDDDVLGEDPSGAALQRAVAEELGKEAALFVPSGTMANLIAAMVWCLERGSEAIVGSESHMHVYEQGGMSTVAGIHPRVLPNEADGSISLRNLRAAIRADDPHFPRSKLICLEQTHNRCGGRCLTVEYTDAVAALAQEHGLKLHIDGARLFNAANALGVSARELVRGADSVSVCLSKGLGAPVGSVVVGSADFIAKARRMRKVLGGGMRQLGVVAAAALEAFRCQKDKLHEDHANAKLIAESINGMPWFEHVDVAAVETNIVYVDVKDHPKLPDVQDIVSALDARGVRILKLGPRRVRFVTHYQTNRAQVERAMAILQEVMAERAGEL
eukprot:jgi/Mesvir1/6457/Mv19536-RA.1